MKRFFLRFISHPSPLRVVLARKIVKHLSLFTYQDRLQLAALERPHYGYCIFQAARLAVLLNISKISVLEFGCGGGRGLLNAEMHIAEIEKVFPIRIELYGFDNGSGLPQPADYRDMPHYFKSGLYTMNKQALEAKLTRAKLVIGDVRDTCAKFSKEYDPAPIGCIFHDLDFYSSTWEALKLLDLDDRYLLPRVFMYFDDIIGDDIWLCNEFTGESLAIKQFNDNHELKKISKLPFLLPRYPHERWPYQIYAFHNFEHARYNDFVANDQQIGHQAGILLN